MGFSEEIDIHGLTVEDARAELDYFLDNLSEDVGEITVIHGYKGGTALKNMVRNNYSHPRIRKKYVSMNQGITVFEIK